MFCFPYSDHISSQRIGQQVLWGVLWGSITLFEMGKQKIQAKRVYQVFTFRVQAKVSIAFQPCMEKSPFHE